MMMAAHGSGPREEDEAAEVSPLLGYAGQDGAQHASGDGAAAGQALRRRGAAACLLLLVAVSLLQSGPAAPRAVRTDSAAPEVGLSGCSVRARRDCSGRCAPTDWIGDGWCDIGTDGHDLNCSLLDYDGGDCAAAALATRQLHCREHELLDCHGNCFPQHWLGDHDCDDPDELDHMVYLNCAALRYDDGDCVFDQVGCEAGYVPAPCVVEQLGLPPVCVPAGWVGDGTCDVLIEDGYVSCTDGSAHPQMLSAVLKQVVCARWYRDLTVQRLAGMEAIATSRLLTVTRCYLVCKATVGMTE
jgi:hypothetical protein